MRFSRASSPITTQSITRSPTTSQKSRLNCRSSMSGFTLLPSTPSARRPSVACERRPPARSFVAAREHRKSYVRDSLSSSSSPNLTQGIVGWLVILLSCSVQILKFAVNQEVAEQGYKIIEDLGSRGYRSLGVAISESESGDDDWICEGMIPLFDPPRHDTAETIRKAQSLAITVKMITGMSCRSFCLARSVAFVRNPLTRV